MHVAFLTTELSPWVLGGAGTLVAEMRTLLIRADHRVSVVLAADIEASAARDDLVVASGTDHAGWELDFMATSKAAAEALARLHDEDPVDLVEVQDFDGLAYWLLTHRGDLGFATVPITVRFHGPVDLQVEAMGASTAELDAVAVMEGEVFAMADGVVVPSMGVGDLVVRRYGVDPQRLRVGPPPVPRFPTGTRWVGGTDFLVIGRLSEVKGSHDMVDAAIPVLDAHPNLTVTFAGADGWSASADRSMQSWLEERIPGRLADRIRFTGQLDRTELGERIAHARVVVVPSRFESFHLGAHEARANGAPVIVPDLPAFEGILDEDHGAYVYDTTVDGLTTALEHAAVAPFEDLAARPAPAIGDPLGPYSMPLPTPRHRRSQGGLATAAIARLEDAWLAPRRSVPPSIGRRVLERVPTGAYATIKRLVPNRIKDRLRDSTDWGEEADRRKWEERFARGVSSMAAKTSRPGDPRVSVVIPCYNQGEFIREALLSVFEQTADGTDVVIVDDGSDDGETGPLLAALDIPGVRVVRQDNAGLPAARNTGIRAARAPLVVTLDADDMLAPEYVERLEHALASEPDAAFAHCWAELVGDTHSIWATRAYNPYQLLLSNSVVGCVMLRRTAWEAVGGYDETMRSGNEDWDLWIRLAAGGYGAPQVRAPLFRYRKHGVSMSVETESRHEAALDDRATRHPELYRRARLAELKSTWYPLLTVIVDRSNDETSSDVQTIRLDGRDVGDVIGEIRGKYVAWLPEGSVVRLAALLALCDALEDDDESGIALSADESPVGVVRTWSLFDPAGPGETVSTDLIGTAPDHLAPGSHPSQDWMVPTHIGEVPVIRQRPEEAGRLPDWVAT